MEVLWDGDEITSPPYVDRETPVKTLPSRRTTYAGGNKYYNFMSHHVLCFKEQEGKKPGDHQLFESNLNKMCNLIEV